MKNIQDLIEASTYIWEEENIYVNICRMHEYKSVKNTDKLTKIKSWETNPYIYGK